ncbi:DUF3592 domain-containing protein [Pseudokineococcus lusitanus]|uniref:DUF3592 domain-containing protein n=1 Tax=Pseudokineococcus lusitanus TaxID=763993 RepID=A0A3N1GWK9_9ACTN|nr:DUF3592 domain-containing protein [Pseudokineococcus lusitanus]ROP34651.1 hypothetical protein EDC03_2468 [Pseudokineococcus lusitanus]
MTTDDAVADETTSREGRRRATVGVVLLAAALAGAALTGAGVSWAQQADLRDLPSLERVDAVVVGEDYRRRMADLVEVRYPVDGSDVTASIPTGEDFDEGDSVEVAFVADDPSRARLVDGWAPPWHQWLFYAALSPAVLLLVLVRRSVMGGARRAGQSLRRRRRA